MKPYSTLHLSAACGNTDFKLNPLRIISGNGKNFLIDMLKSYPDLHTPTFRVLSR